MSFGGIDLRSNLAVFFFFPRKSQLKNRVVPKLGSGSTPVPLKPKFGTLCGSVNGRILKLVVLGSDFLFFKTFGEIERTEGVGNL